MPFRHSTWLSFGRFAERTRPFQNIEALGSVKLRGEHHIVHLIKFYFQLGPGGARLLGKSLQLNQSIQHLSLDRNQIGPDGFVELARALRLNSTLLHLQMPSSDLADSMLAFARSPVERVRLMLVWAEIEQALDRNREMDVIGPTQRQWTMRTMHSLNKVRIEFKRKSFLNTEGRPLRSEWPTG